MAEFAEFTSAESEDRVTSGRATWVEPVATVIIAFAAVLTAWAAFESAKWTGVQAEATRGASAAGTAATHQTTISSAQKTIDVGSYLQWLEAASQDISAGRLDPSAATYTADPLTLSGFIALRFRDEFKPAFNAWIASRPLLNAEAAPTPFELPQYSLAADKRVEELNATAASQFLAAGDANHDAENYVLITVIFAITIVLTSIGSKLRRLTFSAVVLGGALVLVFSAGVVLLTFPVKL